MVVLGDGLPLPDPELGRADDEANAVLSHGTRASYISSMLHLVKITRLLFHASASHGSSQHVVLVAVWMNRA